MKHPRILFSWVSIALCTTLVVLALVVTGFGHFQAVHATSAQRHTTLKSHHPHIMRTRQTMVKSTVSPLQYNGGQVMQSTSTTYAIFWEPLTLQDGTATYVSTNYNSLIQHYFNDIGGSGLYNNNTQYYDNYTGHIVNSSTLGGAWVDTSPYPLSGCSDSYTPHGCLSEAQIEAEITNAIAVNGWTGGMNHIFFVYTSWGEGTCDISNDCAFTQFCAYHYDFTNNGQTVLYATMPYTGTRLNGCGVDTSPNNDFDADSTINLTSHEHMETVTDPLFTSWQDAQGFEIGDKCQWTFGLVTLNGNTANVQWNGHYYIVQPEWNNNLHKCALSGQGALLSGTVYVGSQDGYLYAINTSDGSFRWRFQTGNAITSAATVANGVVYVGSNDASVYAINATTGSQIWQYKTNGPVQSAPSVVNSMIYIGSTDNSLYALDAATGQLHWNYPTNASINSSPTVVNGMVYIGSTDTHVYGLNALTGAFVWSYQTGGAVSSSPRVVNNVLYIGSNDQNLYALNAANGVRIWQSQVASNVISTPAVARGVVYVGSSDGNVHAFKVTNGISIWSYLTGNAVSSSPAVVNSMVFIGSSDHYLYALKSGIASATMVWHYLTGNAVVSSPIVVSGTVFVGSEDGGLYALNATNGHQLWHYTTSNQVSASPIVSLIGY